MTSIAALPAALCAGLALTLACAQAQPLKAPVAPDPSYGWTGFYLGGGGGGAANLFQNRWYTEDGIFSGSTPQAGSGGFLTALAGYDWQLSPRLVFGVMTDIDVGGPRSSFDMPGAASIYFKRDGAWSAGGRLGWLVMPDTLIYVPAGFTQSRYSWVDSYFVQALNVPRSGTAQGWFAGFGLESRIGGNWSVRGEYRYAALGDFCVSSSPTQTSSICRGAGPAQSGIARVEQLAEQSARVALAYRFHNGEAMASAPHGEGAAPRRWTGLYVGAGLGAGALNYGGREYDYLTGAERSELDAYGGKGALVTAQAGYDYQFASRAVAGVFADVDWSRIGSRQVQVNGPASNSGSFNRDFAWSAGARIGWLAMPDTLLYVPFGFTQSRYSWDSSFFSFNVTDKKSFDASLGGFFAGFGIETMFADHWSLRGEYRYALFGGTACVGSTIVQQTPICRSVNDSVDYVLRAEDFREQTVRAVVSYKFN